MKKFIIIFIIAGLIFIIYPATYWFDNPLLTNMQLLKLFWKQYLLGTICLFAAFALLIRLK